MVVTEWRRPADPCHWDSRGECFELRRNGDMIEFRSSHAPDRLVLAWPRAEVRAFFDRVCRGYDLPRVVDADGISFVRLAYARYTDRDLWALFDQRHPHVALLFDTVEATYFRQGVYEGRYNDLLEDDPPAGHVFVPRGEPMPEDGRILESNENGIWVCLHAQPCPPVPAGL